MVPQELKEIKKLEVAGGNSKNMSNLCKLKYHYIYQTKNLINDKTYIGRHSTNNLNDGYVGSGTMLKRAINKYGKENFVCIPMCYFDTYEEAVEEEKFLVTLEYCKDPNNYNIVQGGLNPIMYGENNPSWKGKGGVKYIKKGHNYKIGKDNPNYGKTITEEQKLKTIISKKKKGLLNGVIVSGIHFDSVRECGRNYNISESTVDSRCVSPHFKNWSYSNQEHQRIREEIYYDKVSRRHARKRLKTEKNRKPVIIIENKQYYSFKKAGNDYNIYWKTVQKRGILDNFPNWVFPTESDFEKYVIKFEKIAQKEKLRNLKRRNK